MTLTGCTSLAPPLVVPIIILESKASRGNALLNSNYQLCLRVIALSAVLWLTGCIAHAPNSGGGQQQPLTVTVTPTPASLAVGGQQTFTATVSPSGTSQAVTWGQPTLSSNSAASASGAGLGTVTNGVYTAPATIPACASGITQCNLQVVITATSTANTSFSGQALVNVHVVVAMSPLTNSAGGGPLTIGQGANLQFASTVTGTSNQTVNWSAACTGCAANQGGGGFDPNPVNLGLYIAPPFGQGVTTAQTVTLTATSDFDSNQYASTMISVLPADPLGSATPTTAAGAELTCPTFGGGLAGATCYQVNTSCDGIADYPVYLKVNAPTGTPIGTVIFGTGSGGSALYDYDQPDFFYNNGATNGGLDVVNGVLGAGYTTVQISFGSPFNSNAGSENGWLQGPGGVRRLACRYATVAGWVYQNIHNSNTSAPFCATGNSGGAGAIGYAVFNYGLDTVFSMVELTSGPPMTRVDLGCSPQGSNSYGGKTACTAPSNLDMSYSVGNEPDDGTAGIIDTAYQGVGDTSPTPCSDGVNGISTANNLRFQSDSIEYAPSKSPAIPIPNPPTMVNVVFGGQDGSNAVPQGETWWASIGSGGPKPTQACVQDAPHPIPAAPNGDGVTQIVNDITSLCKLQ
jgi:hypothetical protein